MSVINTNVKSLVAQDAIMKNNRALSTSMQRLSTGSRINSAKDDAAGLAISTRMDSQVRGLSMAIRNANDGISLMQTAEGAMDEVTGILQRMRELAVQSVNGTNNDSDRAAMNDEVQQLKSEIERIATTTEFNNQKILDGSFKEKKLQIGDKSYQTMDVKIGSVKVDTLGMGQGSFSGDTLVSQRIAIAAVAAGDVEINGQALGAIAVGDDMADLVKNINDHVDNVKASGFNTVVAKNVGTGITTDGQFQITVKPLNGGNATTYSITASNSMQELVDNINTQTADAVKASINDDGKLVLSNNNGQTISVKDGSAGAAAYDGGAGFKGATVSFAGFLKLESTDGSPIRIERGNKALAGSLAGSLDDLKVLGFREVTSDAAYANDAYTTVGAALTTPTTAWGQTDLKINGQVIYDEDMKTDSFQGKLDAINNFAAVTGVQASAYYDKTFAIDTTKLIAGNKVKINGIEVTLGADVATTVTNINAQTAKTGLVATGSGNNIKLTGSNVQAVTINYVDPNIAQELQLNSRTAVGITAASAGIARTVNLGGSGVSIVAGREYELTISAASATTVSYIAQAGDTATEVMEGLRMQLLATSAFGTATGITAMTASGGKLTFGASLEVGEALISLHVIDTPAPFGTSAVTSYAGIKLNSTTDQPISIELGEGATDAAFGLLEMNVGAADFQVNMATMGVAGGNTIGGMTISTADAATKAITTIDNAIEKVSKYRSELGAMENRLNATVNNLSNVVTNTQASRSRIQDTDYASETTALAKAQIISQAATAMLAQANQQPQSVLSLLK